MNDDPPAPAATRSRRPASLRFRAPWALLALLASLAASGAWAAAPTTAAQVHAAYVINFIRYTEWPDDRHANGPYVVGVLGSADEVAALRELAERVGLIHERAIEVKPLGYARTPPANAAQRLQQMIGDVHVVHVARSRRAWNRLVIDAAAGRPVLTIGHGSEFVRNGGMLGLFEDDGHTLFTANEAVVVAAPLVVSAKVLKIARPTR